MEREWKCNLKSDLSPPRLVQTNHQPSLQKIECQAIQNEPCSSRAAWLLWTLLLLEHWPASKSMHASAHVRSFVHMDACTLTHSRTRMHTPGILREWRRCSCCMLPRPGQQRQGWKGLVVGSSRIKEKRQRDRDKRQETETETRDKRQRQARGEMQSNNGQNGNQTRVDTQ